MFITKKHIPRRTFLRGAGVTLALPLLESMVPAQTPLRADGRRARRSASSASGIRMARRRAIGARCRKARTSSFRSSRSRSSRSAIGRCSSPALTCRRRWRPTTSPAATMRAAQSLLSGARPRRNAVSPYLGVTIDQMIAQKYGQDTILSSHPTRGRRYGQLRQLQLGLQLRVHELHLLAVAHAAASDGGQSARGLRAPVRRWHERRRSGWPGESRTPAFSIRSRKSWCHFKKDLGAGDRARLDTYVENISELERRIQIAMDNSASRSLAKMSRSGCRKASTCITG